MAESRKQSTKTHKATTPVKKAAKATGEKPGQPNFLSVSQTELTYVDAIRGFIGRFFDFLRNLLIVGLLTYFAEKTGNVWLEGLAQVSLGALIGYYLVMMQATELRLFRLIASNRITLLADLLVWTFVYILAWIGLSKIMRTFVEEIAKAHAS